VNKPELKIKDFASYQSFYCGLCDTLKRTYGRMAQLSLNFDMTFLSIVLTSLYETKSESVVSRCIVHPLKQHEKIKNEWVTYSADMTVVLTCLKCRDDWTDEHKHSARMMGAWLAKSYERIKARYPEKITCMESAMQENEVLEKQHCDDLDALAACSGKLMGALCSPKKDAWEHTLYTFGDYLGRFVYFMDAYDDLTEDNKRGRFNPLRCYEKRENFDAWVKEILEMMIAESAQAFERLPILQYADLIRNILYSGVWAKYDAIRKKRSGDEHAGSI